VVGVGVGLRVELGEPAGNLVGVWVGVRAGNDF